MSEFQLVFEEVFDPFPELFDLPAREGPNRLLDFLNIAAHRHEYRSLRSEFQRLDAFTPPPQLGRNEPSKWMSGGFASLTTG